MSSAVCLCAGGSADLVSVLAQANAEKQRLEKKQRKARKEAEEGVPIRPRWFQPVPNAKRGDELTFKYQGGYWEQRAAGKFTECRDIFGE
jgi:oxysterol-binding protein 1